VDKSAATTAQYVNWFRQSGPYINAHRGKTFVITLGGETLAHNQFEHIIHDIALLNSLGVRLVLVHGARPQIDELCDQKNIQAKFHNNKRITDEPMLVTVMQAVGQLRSQIEAMLSTGMSNSPMHGADIRVLGGNFIMAKPLGVIDGIDFAHTGEVRKVDHKAISKVLDNNAVVLMNCLGYSRTGETFNLPVEAVAMETAIALQADKLIFFGENNCITNKNGGLIKEVITSAIANLLDGNLNAEQATQLNAAKHAVDNGVKRCQLIQHSHDGALLTELFTLDGCGTLISQNPQEQLRAAKMEDVVGILELLKPLEDNGILVRRSREVLETEIDRFRILVKDGMVLGCAALYTYDDTMAELACVAIHNDYRGGDRGDRLLNTLETEAKNQGIKQLFVLTTQTALWFEERGFKKANIEDLPSEKQGMYNFQRNSKVFVKTL
jgi:amino-acid N-acetyltransferase